MLGITDIDLKQTRFYQAVHAEGKQEGQLEGQQLGEARILRQLLTRHSPVWHAARQGRTAAGQHRAYRTGALGRADDGAHDDSRLLPGIYEVLSR